MDQYDRHCELLVRVGRPYLARGRVANDWVRPNTPGGRAYREAPAAKYNHHAYRAGLLEHSLQISAH